MPKKPPPLVPSIFIGMIAASGPTMMFCGLATPLSSSPSRPVPASRDLGALQGHRHPLLHEDEPRISETGRNM